MEIKTEKRTVEIEETIYIAEDGKEFSSEKECIEYEEELKVKELKAIVDKLEVAKFHELYPLDTCGLCIGENKEYNWYKVNNNNELNTLERYYNKGETYLEQERFPEIVCVEHDYCYPREDAWFYLLSNMKKSTIAFWKEFGLDVEFKKVEE